MSLIDGSIPIRIADSVASQINHNQQVKSKGLKTKRLIFSSATNNRTDINIALAEEPKKLSFLLKDRRWTQMKVKVDKDVQTVYVNVNSLAKRLGLQKSEIYKAIKENNLDSLVYDKIKTKLSEISSEKGTTVSAVSTPALSVTSFIERAKGALADAWWSITTGGWDLFRLRFIIGASDEQLQNEGQLRAMTAYHQAYERVPAYKAHVDENASTRPKNFEDIPLTGKKEYIQKVKQVDDLYLDGQIPETGQLDSSTGTTGEPALWIRSGEELAVTQKLMSYAKRAKFGDENVTVINTFALGLWATGITLAGAGPKQGLIANVGIVPDYASKTVAIIKQLSQQNPDRPVVLCGYPPNIRNIAEAIKKDPDLKKRIEEGKLKLHALVGGEGMTEKLRKEILDMGFTKVFSSYGASDLDINIGYETETEVAIRKACIENEALAMELYGGGPPPMIFHYDPLHYFIETTKDGELVYTCCRKERASPRIRYNLHDNGKVMMCKDVVAILQKYGIEVDPKTNLPFLFIHGRDSTVSYGGSKIHIDHLREGIASTGLMPNLTKDRFALYKPHESDQIEFWVEASSDEEFAKMQANLNDIQSSLITQISNQNTDFKKILEGKANPFPQVRLFKPGQSPMSVHAKQNPHAKLQWVATDSAIIKKQLEENKAAYVVSTGDYK